MKKLITKILMITSLLLALTSCDFFKQSHKVPSTATPSESNKTTVNILLGMPDKITATNPTGENNYLIQRDAYILSYNNTTHNPNWVSWHLTKSDMGDIKRVDCFGPDPKLPGNLDAVDYDDYTGSGFSRGHMCPNADRNGDSQMREDTFLMTNMVPQVQNNNGGPWEKLESRIQKVVKAEGKEAYIVSGPVGVGGINNRGTKMDYFLSDNGEFKITVPEATWKVVIILPEGNNDIERLNNSDISDLLVYGVVIPNDHKNVSIKDPFTYYLRSIDYIEEITGYDFFSELDDVIENQIEAINKDKDPSRTIADDVA